MEEVAPIIYSEVFSILNLLGDEFINKLPKQLYELIKREKSSTYNPVYNSIKNLEEQNVRKESISMIAMFHLNYWCDDNEEKQKLRNIFIENEEKYQKEIEEKYSIKNIFNNRNTTLPKEQEVEEVVENALIEVKKENIFTRIINKIKNFFKRK